MTVGRIPNVEGGIQPTLLTTTGDIMYASSASNPARLGIGSTGNVLTVAGGVPAWAAPSGGAGNMAQIATGTLSGASVVISGLSTYTDILVFMSGITNNTANGQAYLRLNATSTNHNSFGFRGTVDTINTSNDSDFSLSGTNTLRGNSSNIWGIKLTNCKNAGFTDVDTIAKFQEVSTADITAHTKGIYTKSEAVSSITLRNAGGTWAGGTYTVWGA
jgi:hypothetical protein